VGTLFARYFKHLIPVTTTNILTYLSQPNLAPFPARPRSIGASARIRPGLSSKTPARIRIGSGRIMKAKDRRDFRNADRHEFVILELASLLLDYSFPQKLYDNFDILGIFTLALPLPNSLPIENPFVVSPSFCTVLLFMPYH
jgi:hypothetical protein